MLEILEPVRSRQIGVCIDSAHVALGSDGPAVFAAQAARGKAERRLHYVHLSAPDRGALEDSWIDWPRFLTPIRAGYDGPYLIEVFNAIPAFLDGLRLTRRKFWVPGEDDPDARIATERLRRRARRDRDRARRDGAPRSSPHGGGMSDDTTTSRLGAAFIAPHEESTLTENDVSSYRAVSGQRGTADKLGPLKDLPGFWEGTGFSLIARPDFGEKSDNGFFLELNWLRETIEFTTIGSPVFNRGSKQADIQIYGLTYLHRVTDGTTGGALHIEPGLWLNIPATSVPQAAASIARLFSIPHGNAVNTVGAADEIAPETFVIPKANTVPFPIGRRPAAARHAESLSGIRPREGERLPLDTAAGGPDAGSRRRSEHVRPQRDPGPEDREGRAPAHARRRASGGIGNIPFIMCERRQQDLPFRLHHPDGARPERRGFPAVAIFADGTGSISPGRAGRTSPSAR